MLQATKFVFSAGH